MCAPTVIHSQAELSGGVRTYSYTQVELSQRGVRTYSYTLSGRAVREEVCTPTVTHSQAELSERGGVHT